MSTYHLVGQDSVRARLIEADEPVETVELVVAQHASFQNGWLRLQPRETEVSIFVLLGSVLSVIEIGATFAFPAVGSENGITLAELAHLCDGVRLDLLQLLGFLWAELEATTLHENELCEEFGLLEEEVEFLASSHLACWLGCSWWPTATCWGWPLRLFGTFLLDEHFGELATRLETFFVRLALLHLLLFDCLSERGS